MKTIIAILACIYAGSVSAWTIKQDFDTAAIGTMCWGDASGGSRVSSEVVYSGNQACKLTVQAGDTAFGRWGGIIPHPQKVMRGGEIWLRARTFWPNGFNYDSTGEGNHLKFFRIHTMSDSVSNFGCNDIYINPKGSNPPFQFIYESEQVWSYIGSLTGTITSLLTGTSTSQAINLGRWETYEFYVKLDTVPAASGGMARTIFWKDGILLKDIKDRITLKTSDGYSDRTHIFTYWNGGAPATQSMYIDDLVLTTDMPAGRDAAGNPYIGAVAAFTPKAPTSVTVQ